jgi:hypothetical protein
MSIMLHQIITLNRNLNNPPNPTASGIEAPHGVECKQGKASEHIQQIAYVDDLIDTLLKSHSLRGWERSYLNAAKATKRRSERQIEKLQAIATRLGVSEEGEA